MTDKKTRGRMPRWGRRYLTLDRYMAGNFLKLFGWAFALSTVCFLVLWGIGALSAKWDIIDTFTQLTNPQKNHNSPWEWVAIVLANLFGLAILNGVILTLFVNWVSNRKERHNKGEARYEYIFTRPYSVIVGGHRIVAALARDLLAKGLDEYVLVQTQRDAEMVRKEIYAAIEDEKQARNVIIYSGDRTSWHELEDLRLGSAREVYVIGEPSYIDGSSHDSLSLRCWELICSHIDVAKEVKTPCHVMFEYQSTFTAFQFTDLKLEHNKTFRFIPFSIYENWAQQVLLSENKGEESQYTPLDGDGISYDSTQRVHLIVAGMSKMGIALATEAAHMAHYPNFNNPAAGRPRTLITFIDRNARRESLFFMGRFRELFRLARWRFVKAPDGLTPDGGIAWNIYDSTAAMRGRNALYPWNDPQRDPALGSPYCGSYLGDNLIDVDFEFIEGDVALPSVQKYIKEACADSESKTTVAVCLPVAAEAMSAALYFEPSVYEDAQQILVQQTESGATVDIIRYGLTGQQNARFRKLRPFGMIDRCDYLTRVSSALPRLIAYAYDCPSGSSFAAEYEKFKDDLPKLMAEVDKVWLSMTQNGGKSVIAKRWSNLYCAYSFPSRIRAAGIVPGERVLEDKEVISYLAETEHNRWTMEQLLLGFRPVDKSYAAMIPIVDKAVKNSLKANNIHPNIISNELLPLADKAYDEDIVKIIPLALNIVERLNRK